MRTSARIPRLVLYCHQEIGSATAELADHAFLLRTQCEKCGKEFFDRGGHSRD